MVNVIICADKSDLIRNISLLFMGVIILGLNYLPPLMLTYQIQAMLLPWR